MHKYKTASGLSESHLSLWSHNLWRELLLNQGKAKYIRPFRIWKWIQGLMDATLVGPLETECCAHIGALFCIVVMMMMMIQTLKPAIQ
jgi:hypothetical protein